MSDELPDLIPKYLEAYWGGDVQENRDGVSVAKEILKQLLYSGKFFCTDYPPKKIALLAPIVHFLYSLATQKQDLGTGIDSLLGEVISHASFLSGHGNFDGFTEENLSACFLDTLRVWMPQTTLENEVELLEAFFPLVSDEVRQEIKTGCGMRYLAGVVSCEALFLRLYLKKSSYENVRWVESVVSAFQNIHFFEILFGILSAPKLPFSHLLDSTDEITLQKALYDAFMSMNYSFLQSKVPVSTLQKIAVKWFSMYKNATRFMRKHDPLRIIPYFAFFKESFLYNFLDREVVGQNGVF